MNAGHFSKNTVSTGDLNRGRRVKPRLLFGSFCRSKKNKPVSLSGAFHCMESMPLSGQHAARAFAPFLLETWSPCSHPFAILPVSAVSDAQKLATGNFLHVRAGSFEVLQTSKQRRFAAFPEASGRCPLPVHAKRVCRLLRKHSQAAKPPYLLRATRLFAKDFRFTVCRQLSKKNLFAYAVKTKPLTHSAPNLRLSHKGILRQKGNVL